MFGNLITLIIGVRAKTFAVAVQLIYILLRDAGKNTRRGNESEEELQ